MKKTMIQFSAVWVPGEGEKEDPNCSINGIVQVIDGKPTDYPAHIIFRDYTEKRPCWWPAVTIPNKKMLSFGPEYGDDELFQTNLHDQKFVKGAFITLNRSDAEKLSYEVVNIADLME